MIRVIAEALESSVLADEGCERGQLTRFHARTKPRIGLKDYLDRLVTFAPFQADVLLLSIYYLRRLAAQSSFAAGAEEAKGVKDFDSLASPGASAKSRRPCVNCYTVHRLILTALVVAAKFLSDSFIPHARACRVGGVGPAELAALEVELLVQLKFELLWPPGALEGLATDLLEGRFVLTPAAIEEDAAVRSESKSSGEECSPLSTPSSEDAVSLLETSSYATPDSSAASSPPTISDICITTPRLTRV